MPKQTTWTHRPIYWKEEDSSTIAQTQIEFPNVLLAGTQILW